MRLHGLVSLISLLLFSEALAQVPKPQQPLGGPALTPGRAPRGDSEPVTLPPTLPESGQLDSLDLELNQLRDEVVAFRSLRAHVAQTTKHIDSNSADSTVQQRRELLELLTKLAARRVPRKPPVAVEPSHSPTKTEEKLPLRSPINNSPQEQLSEKVVDPLALGRVLFRTGDYSGAEQAFGKVRLSDENRRLVQYLIATCLRKQSRWADAIKAYKFVAESDDDPVLRDLAKWQLENIRWYQQMESQIESLKQLRSPTSRAEKRLESTSDVESP
ncbi:MAG: hypothetical protein HZA46_02210 [Planctomycetales bacterium]|nr:hypothetical protein [Planctomycetales bacterium]